MDTKNSCISSKIKFQVTFNNADRNLFAVSHQINSLQMGRNEYHLDNPQVNIHSNHYYPPNNAKLQNDIALLESANKVYLIGEYDWTGKPPQADTLESFFRIIEDRQNSAKPVVAGHLLGLYFCTTYPNIKLMCNIRWFHVALWRSSEHSLGEHSD